MGKSRQDQLSHKRKARSADSLRRGQAKRAPYDRVLIVCEGEKTEPIYLRALIDDLGLSTANVKIVDNKAGSAPISVVEHALNVYNNDKDYEQVYCVFDKDQHPSYDEALQRIQTEKNRGKKGCPIFSITSVPCFEFWILLHFEYTTRSFQPKNGSICIEVIEDLKKFLRDYKKGEKNIYQNTKVYLPTAIKHAKRVCHHCETADTDMPSTDMHKLVEYLQNLKNPGGLA